MLCYFTLIMFAKCEIFVFHIFSLCWDKTIICKEHWLIDLLFSKMIINIAQLCGFLCQNLTLPLWTLRTEAVKVSIKSGGCSGVIGLAEWLTCPENNSKANTSRQLLEQPDKRPKLLAKRDPSSSLQLSHDVAWMLSLYRFYSIWD